MAIICVHMSPLFQYLMGRNEASLMSYNPFDSVHNKDALLLNLYSSTRLFLYRTCRKRERSSGDCSGTTLGLATRGLDVATSFSAEGDTDAIDTAE